MTSHELDGSEISLSPNIETRRRARNAVPQDVFDNLRGRYLLAGTVPEWNRSVDYPMRLLPERMQVALEVLWYIGVRGPLLSLFVLTDIDCRAGTTRSPYR